MLGIKFQILSVETVGSILSIFVIGFIIIFFIYKNHNKQPENQNNFGRRGRKDHAWQILKEYHKKIGVQGVRIESIFVFQRPNKQQLHDNLVKALLYKSKKDARLAKIKYTKPKIPKRFFIEDYFDQLEQETLNLHSSSFVSPNNRKRYVILYKIVKKLQENVDWNAVEVEIVNKTNKEGKKENSVVINKSLDFSKEILWLEPLLDEKLNKQYPRSKFNFLRYFKKNQK